MKHITTLLFVFLALSGHAQKEPIKISKGHKIEIRTSAICEMCQHAIEYDLAFAKGVKEAMLDLNNKVVTIVYNPKKTNPEKLRERITRVGYHADDKERDPVAYEKLPACCKDGAHGTGHEKDHH